MISHSLSIAFHCKVLARKGHVVICCAEGCLQQKEGALCEFCGGGDGLKVMIMAMDATELHHQNSRLSLDRPKPYKPQKTIEFRSLLILETKLDQNPRLLPRWMRAATLS